MAAKADLLQLEALYRSDARAQRPGGDAPAPLSRACDHSDGRSTCASANAAQPSNDAARSRDGPPLGGSGEGLHGDSPDARLDRALGDVCASGQRDEGGESPLDRRQSRVRVEADLPHVPSARALAAAAAGDPHATYSDRLLVALLRAYAGTVPWGRQQLDRLLAHTLAWPSPLADHDLVLVLRACRATSLTTNGLLEHLGPWLSACVPPHRLAGPDLAAAVLATFASAAVDREAAEPPAATHFQVSDMVFEAALAAVSDHARTPAAARLAAANLCRVQAQILFGTGQLDRADRLLTQLMPGLDLPHTTALYNSALFYWVFRRRDFARGFAQLADLQSAGLDPDAFTADLVVLCLLQIRFDDQLTHVSPALLGPRCSEATANLIALTRNYPGLRPRPATFARLLRVCQLTGQQDEAQRLQGLARALNVRVKSPSTLDAFASGDGSDDPMEADPLC